MRAGKPLTPGACLPIASVRPLTMPALICRQRSRAEHGAGGPPTAFASVRPMQGLVMSANIDGMACKPMFAATPDLEQVITRHAGLPRHASRHDDNVGALERLCQVFVAGVALSDKLPWHVRIQSARHDLPESGVNRQCRSHLCRGTRVDVTDVSCHSGSPHDIVEREVADKGRDLQSIRRQAALTAGACDVGHTL
jgi:hypothetical protein